VPLYPFLLEPIYKEKVWGGRRLETLGRDLPGGDVRIGESWELADLDSTSPSGGGGAGAHSRIVNGPLIKRTLGEVIGDFGPLVTGSLALSEAGKFPLLLKYLDARENLSVQVHPSPEYAEANPDLHLKSEAWYVVEADADAVLYLGVIDGTTREEFEAAIESGTVPDFLIRVPARAGDCHYLPSGTCHALGGGVLVAEVQTPSDTTFRVFDWGRTDRELHVEPALESMEFGPMFSAPDPAPLGEAMDGVAGRRMVECEHFRIDEWKIDEARSRLLSSGEPSVLMMIRGSGVLSWGVEEPHTLDVRAGHTVLLPAALAATELSARSDITLLEVTVPAVAV
jgi:mannose-6-phosphate isomerase